MVGTILCVVLFIGQVALAVEWTAWGDCPGSLCFKSRFLKCKIGNDSLSGFECADAGDAYFEKLNVGCTSLCTQWSKGSAAPSCSGNCYNSKAKYDSACQDQEGCTKTQMARCFNDVTCLGKWNKATTGPCTNLKCAVGTQTVSMDCKINSHLSYSCPGTNGTIASKRAEQRCYQCDKWSEWSSEECSANCSRLKKRSCVDNSMNNQCADSEQTESESCTGGVCSPITGAASGSRNLSMYISIGAGGAGFLLVVLLAFMIVKRRSNEEPKMSDNKTGQVYITEIDRLSPTVDGPRMRRSFGSHYETVEVSPYADPDEMLSPAQKAEKTRSIKSKKERKATERNKSTSTEKAMDSYVMAADIRALPIDIVPSYQQPFDAVGIDSSDSFEDDDVNTAEPAYATIMEGGATVAVGTDTSKKYAKVKKKKKKKGKTKEKEQEVEPSIQEEQLSPYYEGAFENRAFAGPASPGFVAMTPVNRSMTTRMSTSTRQALKPKSQTVKLPKGAKRERSGTELQATTEGHNRGRSVTAPAQPPSNPTSPTSAQYTDMSGKAAVQSVQYTDMNAGENVVAEAAYAETSLNGYTGMSAGAGQIPDAYSLGTDAPPTSLYEELGK